jgi:hypothetical protein
MRMYRKGTLDLDPPAVHPPCSVEGCMRERKGRSLWCAMHTERVRKWGDPSIVHAYVRSNDIGYGSMHQRVRTDRGSASAYACVDCGATAQHWSYDHSGRSECASTQGAYSTDVSTYEPRCVPCHKVYDLRIASDRTQP